MASTKSASRLLSPIILILLGCFHTGCVNKESSPTNQQVTQKKNALKAAGESEMTGAQFYVELHKEIRTNPGDTGPRYSTNQVYREFLTAQKKSKAKKNILDWKERGPGNVGGRTRGLWLDPRDNTHQTILAASVGGGVWKTTDGGNSWNLISPELTNMATATIAGCLSSPDILYVGTGEGFSSFSLAGNGIWKSIDGGQSWVQLQSSVDEKFSNVSRIVVDPNDPDIVLASTRTNFRASTISGQKLSAILKSTDGGMTWDEKLNGKVNSNGSSRANAVQQIIADPNDFNILYASMNSKGIYKSTDKGDTWSLIFNITFKNNDIERMEIAVSPSQPGTLYFAAEDGNESSLYRSDDYGVTWKDAVSLLPNWLDGQGWYDNTIAVNPYNPNNVLVAGSGSMLSIDAQSIDGNEKLQVEFTPVTDGYNDYNLSSKGVHVDHHNIILVPENNATENFIIINANDGGIAISYDSGQQFLQTGDLFQETNSDTGAPRFTTAKSYNTSQFYGVDKMNGSNRYVGGTQDNGSWVSGNEPDANSSWASAPSGDGFEAAWHYTNSDWILESSQFNRVYKSIDGGLNWRVLALPGNGPFFTKLANSKQDPNLVYAVSSDGALISTDFGDSWKVTALPDNSGGSRTNTAVSVSLASPNVVWYGNSLSDNRRFAVSTDQGESFSSTNKYPAENKGTVSSIATHPINSRTAFALFSQSGSAKVLKTTDLGQSWEDISGYEGNNGVSDRGFPDVAAYSLIVMPFDTNQIWVGTEIGLFESLDGGDSWNYANNGLPPLAIWQMKIVNDEVILATHARGIWTASLPELENYEPLTVALAPRLNSSSDGFNGSLSGSYNLRSAADSTRVTLTVPIAANNTITQSALIESNPDPIEKQFTFQVELNTDDIITGTITVESYVNGEALLTTGEVLLYDVDDDSPVDYFNSFDENKSDFVYLEMSERNLNGFDNRAIHSSHPYTDRNTEFTILQKPYIVSSDKPLTFDEIVIVEPGDTDDIFSEDFFDYVGIEATADNGATWVTIDRYDSRANNSWVDIYNLYDSTMPSTAPTSENYINRNLDLTPYFSKGTKVYLKFSLVSDPLVTGWGWALDNIQWGENTTSTVDIIPELSEFNLYPNPTSISSELNYTLLESAKVSISLYSIDGKLINTPLPSTIQSKGIQTQLISISDVSSGLYLIELKINEKRRIIKLQKVN